jgi:hypothetical protein
MSGIEKELLDLSRNEIWADVMKKVIMSHSAKQTAEIITKYAKLLGKTSAKLAGYLDTAFTEPDKYVVPLMKKHGKYFTSASKYGEKALEVHHSGILATLSAMTVGITPGTIWAGFAGTARTFLTGLGYAALAGVVILGAIMGANFIAESWGTHGADDPIEPTWIGGSDIRNVYSAHFTATMDGRDVTNTLWSEPGFIALAFGESAYMYNYGSDNNVVRGSTYGEICDLIEKRERISRSLPPREIFTYAVHSQGMWPDNYRFSVECTRKVVGKQRTARERSYSGEPFRGYKDIVIEGQ